MRHLFVVGSLDKQMQNEKELIRLASAGVGGLFAICFSDWLYLPGSHPDRPRRTAYGGLRLPLSQMGRVWGCALLFT